MLSSAEVGTMVTALGCGIGTEEFNPDKLRYHSIIIMTDADVDGSHIRTLLLTFFFRQMRELIERGHVFIAQPPLYKISKGKQHQYLKDDAALESFLTQTALEDSALFISPDAPPVSGTALESLVTDYRRAEAVIRRLSRLYPEAVLKTLLDMPGLNAEALADEAAVTAWAAQLDTLMAESNTDGGSRFVVSINEDTERHLYRPAVAMVSHGISSNYVLTRDFFSSEEYRVLRGVAEQLAQLLEDGAYVQRGERKQPVQRFEEALAWLMNEAKRGCNIQRYKGLGEMNPSQLWETTMDPEVRRMLRVTIDDAVGADRMFTCLMGDAVEPRREFIETNALAVANLDV
jgi:DNA gyrase subunit B